MSSILGSFCEVFLPNNNTDKLISFTSTKNMREYIGPTLCYSMYLKDFNANNDYALDVVNVPFILVNSDFDKVSGDRIYRLYSFFPPDIISLLDCFSRVCLPY